MGYGLALGAKTPQEATAAAMSKDLWIALDIQGLLELERGGARPTVPTIFYDTEAYNRIALEIYRSLLGAFSDCDALLSRAGTSKYLNLVAVFFHEILRVLCAFYYKRLELDYILAQYPVDGPHFVKRASPTCPYVDYDFVVNPTLPISGQALVSDSYGSGAKKLVRQLVYRVKASTISWSLNRDQSWLYASSVDLDLRHLMKSLNGNEDGLRWGIRVLRPAQAKIVLPHLEAQFESLKASVFELPKKLGLAAPDNLFEVVKLWIRSYLADKYTGHWRPDVLLTGSPVNPETRLAAARAKAEGIPVVSILHGESTGVLDEPVFGYGENTFVDTVVGNGDAGCAQAAGGDYGNSLYDEPVSYVPAASPRVKRLHTGTAIPKLSQLDSPRYMYVPTSFTGSGRYGPYRDIHDVAYLEWQRGVLACAAKQFPGRVLWKQHPSDKRKLDGSPIGVTLVSKEFEDALEAADVFIFDYISTAFTLAAGTSKPIVYFDIGLRNLTPSAMRAVKARCMYVRVDPLQPEAAWRCALDHVDKRCVDNYTSQFCLAADARPRGEVIAGTILQAAGG